MKVNARTNTIVIDTNGVFALLRMKNLSGMLSERAYTLQERITYYSRNQKILA